MASNLTQSSQWPPIDVPALIALSRPTGSGQRLGLVVPAAWALVLATAIAGKSSGVSTAVAFVAIAATASVSMILRSSNRGVERERQVVGRIEDQLALKNVGQVLPELSALLSRPMRRVDHRLRALVLLATALARIDRQDDALLLYEELLDREQIIGPGAAAVRLARAVALLKADRLYDADRAISDLRRDLSRRPQPDRRETGPAATPEAAAIAGPTDFSTLPAAGDAMTYAATRLVELYRDVKTGHPVDAIELFTADRQALRTGLGHRYAEALALVAAAHDRLNHPEEAAGHFADATALAPAVDLVRRYPELAPLPGRYAVTPTPFAPAREP